MLDLFHFRCVKYEFTVVSTVGALCIPTLDVAHVSHLGVATKVVPTQCDAVVALGRALTIEAVGGRQNDVGGDEGTAADVCVVCQPIPPEGLLKRHQVGIARGSGGLAADDPGRRQADSGRFR